MNEAFIEGRGIELRPVRTDEQKQAVLDTVNEAPQNHFITHTPFSPDELEARAEDDSVMLFTVHEEGDDAVGFVMAGIEERDSRVELGAAIKEDAQGNGYGTRAVKELTNFVFERLPVQKVFGRRFGFNEPSARLLDKCGYSEETVIPNHRYSRGEMQDVAFAALYRDEWENSPIYTEGESMEDSPEEKPMKDSQQIEV